MAKKKLKPPPGPRTTRSTGMGWWLGVSAVIVAGILLVVVSRGDRPSPDTTAGPPIGAHWHVAVGVYACGEWVLPHPPELRPLPDPHTHADGLIHAEPLSSASAYTRGTLGRFADVGNWSISDSRLRLWTGATFANGDPCEALDNQPGQVRWALNGEEQGSNPADYVIADGDVVVVAFMPEGEEFPTLVPWADSLAGNGSPVNHPDWVAPEDPSQLTTTTGPAPEGEGEGEGEGDGEGEGEPGEGDGATTTTAAGEGTTQP